MPQETSYLWWNTVAAASCYGDAFHVLGQGIFPELKEQWMSTNTAQYCRRTYSRMLWTYGWGEDPSFNLRMTLSTRPKRHWNGSTMERWMFWNGQVTALIFILLRNFGTTWKLLSKGAVPATYRISINTAKNRESTVCKTGTYPKRIKAVLSFFS